MQISLDVLHSFQEKKSFEYLKKTLYISLYVAINNSKRVLGEQYCAVIQTMSDERQNDLVTF